MRRRRHGEAMGRLQARNSSVELYAKTSRRWESSWAWVWGCVAETTLNIAAVS